MTRGLEPLVGQDPLQQQTAQGLVVGKEGDAGPAQAVEDLVFIILVEWLK